MFNADERVVVSPRSYARLRSLLIRRSNLNISLYKDVYLRRRLKLRMRISQCATTEDYLSLAENNPEECRKLVSTLTINVTRFFRNFETFKKIGEIVIPEIVKNRKERDEGKINILSVGCSTGEEPYSVAILFLEYFKKTKKEFDLRVIGTDVDRKALFVAIKGIYSKDKVLDVPEDMLSDYFITTDKGYQVSNELRSSVVFLKKDVLTHRVHRRFDLILARNILIYFSRSYQEVLEERFYKQLVQGGFLSLGRTESLVGRGRQLFSAVSVPDRIYRTK